MRQKQKALILIFVLIFLLAAVLFWYNFKGSGLPADTIEQIELSEEEAANLDPGVEEIKYEGPLPEGFPEDMPVDKNPLRLIESKKTISRNPPPEDGETLVYSYAVAKPVRDAFVPLLEYAKEEGLSVESSIEEDSASFTGKLGSYYWMTVIVNGYDKKETVVTISITTRPSQKP